MPLLFQWRRRRRLEIRAVSETSLRQYLDHALTATGITDRTGSPLRYTFHDFRRLFITDAIMHGTPSHIAQLVAGHRDINTTIGYKAVYPDTALLRTIDLGVDARKALSHSQFEVFAAWRHRRTDSVVRTCRQEAIRLVESIIALDAELIDNRKERDATVEDVASELCEMPGVGSVAAACILTARSHPGRVRSETAFAALAGTCP